MAVRLDLDDAHDQRLVAAVRPRDWTQPSPKARYHLVIIGAGPAGLVAAAGAAALGADVALVERELMGGDCLNGGCVPSKALLAAARAAAAPARSADLGVSAEVSVDFPAVMARVRRLRADLSAHDSVARFTELGVDVFLGRGRLAAADRVVVEGEAGEVVLTGKHVVIATGCRPVLPSIPGLADAAPLTNEEIFSLTSLPQRLGVIGGGVIGCELAQAFARLGSTVTLFEQASGLLSHEPAEAAAVVQTALVNDGVHLELSATIERVEPGRIHVAGGAVSVDAILVAAGRAPNLDGLGLEDCGVATSNEGVTVDDQLRTNVRGVWACGDVATLTKFTHAADFSARIVLQNALFPGQKSMSALTIPWCTYTDPELGRVGLSQEQAAAQGVAVDVYRKAYADLDRAVLDGRTEGFAEVLCRKGSDTILGATVVGAHAGELVGELSLAMTHGLGLGALARTIHPYPTYGDLLRQLGALYDRSRLTPFAARALGTWLSWTR